VPVPVGLAEQAADGCLVKPLFHQFILDDNPGIEIDVRVLRPTPRAHDGRFHASQHPLAAERELYEWMTGRSVPEQFNYVSRASVMMGSLAHGVFEAFLDWTGCAVPLPEGDCPSCGRPYRQRRSQRSERFCKEHGFAHHPTRSSCHLDSILDFGDGFHGFDLKTIHQFGLRGVRDMDEQAFRAKWPGYWAQGQECMRISGLRRYIFLFFTLGNPWDTREFHFGYDEEHNAQVEAKYLRVLSHLDRGVPIIG
jgi:hypothetical protein